MTLPSISIITVTLNSQDTLRDCIESVLCQSIDVEHIIIDGASKDDTLTVIDSYKDSLAKVISEPDKGIYDAMNKGLKLASSDIIGILNSDDFYASSDILKKVTNAFLEPDVEACYGDLVFVDRNFKQKVTRFWSSGYFYPSKFYSGWMPPHPAFFVRRSVYEKHGLFNLNLGSAADYEIMLRFLFKLKLKVTYIPYILVHQRTGGVSNISISNRLKANRNDRKAWEINGLRPYPWTILLKPLRKFPQWIVKSNLFKKK